MAEKRPTEILEDEHGFILKVVGAMARLVATLEQGQEVEPNTLRDIVDFMRTYADRCHHGKEETHLFPALARSGVPMTGCPVGALTHEHDLGRARVSELATAAEGYQKGEAGAREAVLASLRRLIELYPNHIWKEDYLLFPMSLKVLSRDEEERLHREFERVEEALGRDLHQRFEQFAADLDARAAASPPDAGVTACGG